MSTGWSMLTLTRRPRTGSSTGARDRGCRLPRTLREDLDTRPVGTRVGASLVTWLALRRACCACCARCARPDLGLRPEAARGVIGGARRAATIGQRQSARRRRAAARSMQALVSGLKPLLRRATTLMPPNPNGRRSASCTSTGCRAHARPGDSNTADGPSCAVLEEALPASAAGRGSPRARVPGGLLYGIRDPTSRVPLVTTGAPPGSAMDRSADASRIESGLSAGRSPDARRGPPRLHLAPGAPTQRALDGRLVLDRVHCALGP